MHVGTANLIVSGARVKWSFVSPAIVTYCVVINSIADVVSVAVSRGASVGVDAAKVVLSTRAEVPVSRAAARIVKRMSSIVAMRAQQAR